MKLSAAIMAHPVRTQMAEELQQLLDRPTPIIYDKNPIPSKDPAQRWATGARAWAAHDPDADWHVVIQDDTIPATNLLAGLEQALQHVPNGHPASAYIGGNNTTRARAAAAKQAGETWIVIPRLIWGPAIILPTTTINDMLEWCTPRATKYATPQSNYDSLIAAYYLRARRTRGAWHTNPSLVSHRDAPSLVGHAPARDAINPAPGVDALRVDWSRIPHRSRR